jgi:adenylate kinase
MTQIRVGGVYGVGKTTVIDRSLEILADTHNVQIPKIKGSEIMAKILGIHHDLLPEQPEESRKLAREMMYEEIARMPDGIRDGHFAVVTERGDYEFPRSPVDHFCVGALIIVTANAEVVAARRAALGRIHRSTDLDDIRRHQRVEADAGAGLAEELGVPYYIVDNSADTPETAVDLLSGIILEHSNAEADRTHDASRINLI